VDEICERSNESILRNNQCCDFIAIGIVIKQPHKSLGNKIQMLGHPIFFLNNAILWDRIEFKVGFTEFDFAVC
jgi:hypothetical protein